MKNFLAKGLHWAGKCVILHIRTMFSPLCTLSGTEAGNRPGGSTQATAGRYKERSFRSANIFRIFKKGKKDA